MLSVHVTSGTGPLRAALVHASPGTNSLLSHLEPEAYSCTTIASISSSPGTAMCRSGNSGVQDVRDSAGCGGPISGDVRTVGNYEHAGFGIVPAANLLRYDPQLVDGHEQPSRWRVPNRSALAADHGG